MRTRKYALVAGLLALGAALVAGQEPVRFLVVLYSVGLLVSFVSSFCVVLLCRPFVSSFCVVVWGRRLGPSFGGAGLDGGR